MVDLGRTVSELVIWSLDTRAQDEAKTFLLGSSERSANARYRQAVYTAKGKKSQVVSVHAFCFLRLHSPQDVVVLSARAAFRDARCCCEPSDIV